jgi:hypothetical protein
MYDRMNNFALRAPEGYFLAWLYILTFVSCLQFLRIKIDTDPENMLPEDEFVRNPQGSQKRIRSSRLYRAGGGKRRE